MTNEIAMNQKSITTKVLNRVNEMAEDEGLALPKNYNPANALQKAYLDIRGATVNNRPVLDVVTPESVAESLLDMVLQGLSPSKNQCYFIPYGNKLQMQRSYKGTQTVLKRLNDIEDIWANVIYDGDEFVMEIDDKGIERFIKHDTNWMNRDNEIVGVYAIVETKSQGNLLTVMTKKEVEASWSQAKTKNVHNKFGQEMAKRTVINRAAKNIIDTSDDSDLLVEAINRTTENEYDPDARRRDVTEAPKSEKTENLLDKFKETQPKKPEEAPVEEPEENKDGADTFENQEEPPAEPEEEVNPFDEIENAEYADFEEMNEPEEPEEEKQNLTVPKLREKLDELGVKHDSNMRKAELEGLYEMAQNGGVQDDLF